jgi:carnitine 3-dehydrogenase
MGQSLQWHLGGGAGGIQHFMDHLMPPLEGMMKSLGTPNVTPELRQKVIDGVMREAAGRSVDQLGQAENRVLIGLLKLREETGFNEASAEPMPIA